MVDSDLSKPFKQAREKELLPILQAFRHGFHPHLVNRFGIPEVLSLDRMNDALPEGDKPFLLVMPVTALDSYLAKLKRLQREDVAVKLLIDSDGVAPSSDETLRLEMENYNSQHARNIAMFSTLGTNSLLFRLLATFSYHEDCYSLEPFERTLRAAA